MMTDDWLYLSQVEGWQAGEKTNAIRLRVSRGTLEPKMTMSRDEINEPLSGINRRPKM
jgi:hypothetical protein